MPDLGKYSTEVLGAYGATVLILAALVWVSWVRSRKLQRALKAAEKVQADG